MGALAALEVYTQLSVKTKKWTLGLGYWVLSEHSKMSILWRNLTVQK